MVSQGDVLRGLVDAARKDGWASTAELRWAEGHLERQVRLFGYNPTPTRRDELQIEILTPTEKGEARPNSLSAQYGTGQQPLHTDGAHLADPPDVVLLATQNPSSVPTFLWKFPTKAPPDIVHDIREGLFTVRTGSLSFLAPAVESYFFRPQVRYDPGCMSPADGRASRVKAFIEAALEEAIRFDWTTPTTVLAINNRLVLHARGDASGEPDRRIERVALRLSGTAR